MRKIALYEDGEETIYLNARWAICSRCHGDGTHVNPAVDGNGITQEEMDQDPDFFEAYMSGQYDIRCEECDGSGKVAEPDPHNNPAELLEAWEAFQKDLAESRAIEAQERRMGA